MSKWGDNMSIPRDNHRLRHQCDARAHAAWPAVWPRFSIRPVISFVLLLILLTAGLVSAGTQPAFAGDEPAFGTVEVAAADWMTANGGAVAAYSNGDSGYTSYDYSSPAVGMKWQCVELTQRLYQAKGWHSGSWSGVSSAYQIYDNASANGLQAHPNDGSYTPVPGDMIVHSPSTHVPAGHVAIVDHVSGNKVYVVEQNVAMSAESSAGRASYTIDSRGVLTRDQSIEPSIRGIVHSPKDSYTNGTAGSTDTDGDGVPDNQDWCPTISGTTTNHGCPNNNIQISGDLNGDGKADVIAISRDISDGSPYIYWFQSTSTTGTPSLADPVFLEHLPAPGWNMNNLKWAVGDFNGDGKADLFVASGNPSTGAVVMYVLLSTGTGLASPVLVKQPSLAWQWPLLTFMTGDVNGDGKADVIAISRDISDGSPYIYTFNSTSVGSTPSLADPVFLEHLPAPGWNMNNLKWAVGDFNGDGKADLFVASGNPSTGAVVMYVLLSTGTGLASPVLVKQPSLAWQWPLLTF
jgi:hypothetical protein